VSRNSDVATKSLGTEGWSSVGNVTRIFQRLVGGMKQNTLLRVHAPGFAGADLEKPVKNGMRKLVTRTGAVRNILVIEFVDTIDKVAGVSLHQTLGGLTIVII